MRLPSPERSRSYALGLLLLALAVAYLIGVHWWWTAPMLSMGQRMDDLRAQELHLRMLAQQKPDIEKRLAAVRRIEAANPGFLPEASVELAQAGLTKLIESQVGLVSPDHSTCMISQRTPTASAIPERYQRVLVQVRLQCGMNEFSALLHAFENGRPQLFVDNLNIISRTGFAPLGGADAAAPLEMSFDLYGYLRPGVGGGNGH